MNTWFRFYNEVLDDPKVQKLSPNLFKSWINVLCLASRNDGHIPPLKDAAFSLRLSINKCEMLLVELEKKDLIENNDGIYSPHAWSERQFQSDNSTERVKRFRKRFRNVSETPNVTPPDQTRPETDTEQSKPPLIPPLRKSLKSVPEPMPVNDDDIVWARKNHITIDLESETAAMIDWAHSKAIRRADWNATRRNWWRRAQQTKGTANVKLDRQERNAQTARRLLSRLHPENGSGLQRGFSGIDAVDLPGTLAPIDSGTNPNGSKPHD